MSSNDPSAAQVTGQQSAPSSTVPHTPGLPGYAATTTPTNNLAVVSFVAGLGIAGIYQRVRELLRRPLHPAPCILLPALLPFVLNFRAASRAHGPDALLPRDFAYDLLQSAEPYGILFTNGDNDTFPLWYMQTAEGFRQDVSVINLSLANTPWFIRQMRDNPVRPFRPEHSHGHVQVRRVDRSASHRPHPGLCGAFATLNNKSAPIAPCGGWT